MAFVLSQRSRNRLVGVHPDLVRVVERAIGLTAVDFVVSEGARSIDRQRDLVASGRSKTLNSKHLIQADGYAHAVDLVATGDLDGDGDIDAQDTEHVWDLVNYAAISAAVMDAARSEGVVVRWGGTFKTRDGKPWVDGPHFELT